MPSRDRLSGRALLRALDLEVRTDPERRAVVRRGQLGHHNHRAPFLERQRRLQRGRGLLLRAGAGLRGVVRLPPEPGRLLRRRRPRWAVLPAGISPALHRSNRFLRRSSAVTREPVAFCLVVGSTKILIGASSTSSCSRRAERIPIPMASRPIRIARECTRRPTLRNSARSAMVTADDRERGGFQAADRGSQALPGRRGPRLPGQRRADTARSPSRGSEAASWRRPRGVRGKAPPSQSSGDLRPRLSLARSAGATDKHRVTPSRPCPPVREWRLRQLAEGLGSDRRPPRLGQTGLVLRIGFFAPLTAP